MFCNDCICHRCPYSLRCHICDMWLDEHILIVNGCDGQRECGECPLDYITRLDTKPEHAEMLREMIRNKDVDGIEAFFDQKTGPYHKADRERFEKWKREQEKKKHAND